MQYSQYSTQPTIHNLFHIKAKHLKAHMDTAKAFSKLSHAKRLKVGCSIVHPLGAIMPGLNGMPLGHDNCCEDENNVTLQDVIHAEINGLRKLTETGLNPSGCIMFVTHSPCNNCSEEIIKSGIKVVVFETEYRDPSPVEKLLNSGVEVYILDTRQEVHKLVDLRENRTYVIGQ